MDEAMRTVLADYEARLARENAQMDTLPPEEVMTRINEFLIPVGPVVGRFLHDLAIAAGAKLIVELGTSYGYSTVWLAAAARETGGRVISMDVAAEKQAHARSQLERAGLAGPVEFLCGDAVSAIGGLADPVDLVLVDLWKDLYLPCIEALAPKMAPGGYAVADNMIHPEAARDDVERYRARVAQLARQSVLLPLGNGIEVSRFADHDRVA